MEIPFEVGQRVRIRPQFAKEMGLSEGAEGVVTSVVDSRGFASRMPNPNPLLAWYKETVPLEVQWEGVSYDGLVYHSFITGEQFYDRHTLEEVEAV